MTKEKGITLVALVVTIIILVILAGVTIRTLTGEHGILGNAKMAKEEHDESQAREILELAMQDLIIDKKVHPEEYNEGEYIDNYLKEQGMEVEGDKVTVEGWMFEIDRSVPKIAKSLGRAGEKIEEKTFAVDINIQETKRKITVTLANSEEGIQKIELIAPNGKVIVTKDIGEGQTSGDLEEIANISGKYTIKVTSENNKVAVKTTDIAPITISNKQELVEFGEMVNSGITFEGDTITLLQDIDLGGSSSNRNWVEIGNLLGKNYFAGTFEGNNKKIFNIYNVNTVEGRQGLFGTINGGTVQNLGIESGHIIGDRNIGGIAGQAINNSNIINCYNKAKVEGGNTTRWAGYSGGIVGTAVESTIRNCYNEGEIIGYCDSNGGIVGLIKDGVQVLSCYNTGKVIGHQESAGGIVGGTASINDTGITNIINNCYNKGNITGGSRVGGIIGRETKNDTEVRNSYSTGKVAATNATEPMAGGVIGEHNGVLDNLWFINTAGPYYGCGQNNTEYFVEESTGSTEATLKGLTNKLNGNQNPRPWTEDKDNINEGYPILSW